MKFFRYLSFSIIGILIIGFVSLTALYSLSYLALYNIELPHKVKTNLPVDTIDTKDGHFIVTLERDGTAKIYKDDTFIGSVSGHVSPIVQASFSPDGKKLISTDLSGTVRNTYLNGISWRSRERMGGIVEILKQAFWQDILKPISHWALSITVQVIRLEIPSHLKVSRGRIFKDCTKCPEMVVLKPGAFFMGSPFTDFNANDNQRPVRLVMIKKAIAVSRFQISQNEWNSCTGAQDLIFGIQTYSWSDAQRYTSCLHKITGKNYRIINEAEWEYVARSGYTSLKFVKIKEQFSNISRGFTDLQKEWTQDCWHKSFENAPKDHNAWLEADGGNCSFRVLRTSISEGKSRSHSISEESGAHLRIARDLD